MASLSTFNNAALISLFLLSLLGLWGTWGIGGRTGFLGLIKDTLDAPVQLLPVVKQPVKHTYTRIGPVDALIRRLNVFLWPAIDGTWPGLCLVAWEFSGQFSGTWMIAGLEGLRHGNRGKIISYTTIIGTLSQTITYGTILPLYLFLHVLTSPTNLGPSATSSNEDLVSAFLIDSPSLAAWAPAFTLSYLIPTLLVTLPSPAYTSFTTHQNIMAWWEFYTVPFKIFQIVLARSLFAALPLTAPQPQNAETNKARNLTLLKWTYAFAAAVSGISHIISVTLSFSPVLFPTLFTPASRSSLQPSNVFVPVSPFYKTPITNLGDGLWHFLIWNMSASNVAPLLWGVLQLRNASEWKQRRQGPRGSAVWDGWPRLLTTLAGLSVVGGPAVGVAWCLWRRDELVLEANKSEVQDIKRRG